jgi:hypothetical protein
VRALLIGAAGSAALLALGACYPIETVEDTALTRAEPGLHGYYYLPRTLLTVAVKPQTAQAPNPAPDSPAALAAPAQGTPPPPAKGTPAPKQPGQQQPSDQRPSGGPVTPQGDIISIEEITLSKAIDADPRTKLLYRFEPSVVSDDVLQVDTDESGLLSAVSSDTTDRTGDIIVSLADLIFTIATHGAALPSNALIAPKLPFAATYDPFDYDDLRKVRPALRAAGYCILVGRYEVGEGSRTCNTSVPRGAGPEVPAKAPWIAPVVDYSLAYGGIYYRRPVPTPIEMYERTAGSWQLIWKGSQPLFDKSDFYQITIDRGQFIEKQTTIKFTNGSLTSIKLSKPSEALAFVNIPVKVARIAFAIPLAGLQQDTNLVDAETKLATSQANLINAQSSLLKLQVKQAGPNVVAIPAGH